MKTFYLTTMIAIILLFCTKGLDAQKKTDLIGKWNSTEPTAPEGFQTSIMTITKDSVFTAFNGESYKYPSTFMKFKKDTLTFNISGINVLCTLTFENKTKMTGNSVWSSGESKVTLIKIDNSKTKQSKQK